MTKAATRAKTKYNKENYDETKIRVFAGELALIDRCAEQAGLSRNAFMRNAIIEKIEREGTACDETKQDT